MDALEEGIRAQDLPNGVNDAGHARYDGPRPPRGDGVHHYRFRLAALDVPSLQVNRNSKVADIWEAAKPHILAEADLTGTYATSG